MARRSGIVGQLFAFVRENRAYWIAPVLVAVLLLAGIVVLGALGGGAAAPFIYTLF